jgi:flagellar basal-body rod protein FlgG
MNGLYGVPQAGLQDAMFRLNAIANNIANVNTSGYEAEEPVADAPPAQGDTVQRSEQLASLMNTSDPSDLVSSGNDMFALRQADGTTAYSRQVHLQVQPNGQLATDQGLALVPALRVPAGWSGVRVDSRGAVTGVDGAGNTIVDATGKPITVGTLAMATFAAPQNLNSLGGGLYSASLSSGRAQTPAAGSVQIMSGYQLGSNVDLATEMVEMIETQRAYDASTKALQAVDSLVNGAVSIPVR